MSMTLERPAPVVDEVTADPDSVCHYVCERCYPPPYDTDSTETMLAICGTDVTGEPEIPLDVESFDCVMCVMTQRCPVCGILVKR